MHKAIDQFQAYLLAHKQITASTRQAYKKDIAEFLNFLVYQHNRTLENLREQDFTDFFSFLKKRKISLAIGMRKVVALKLFARYLHEICAMPDFTKAITVDTSFPLLCNKDKIAYLLQSYEQRLAHIKNDYKELRKYIIVYLLFHTRLTVSQLVGLHTYDMCYHTGVIRVDKSGEKKEIALPYDFCSLVRIYSSLDPYKSTYLFPIKLGTTITAISKQAVWSLLRSLFNHIPTHTTYISNTTDQHVQHIYKTIHPRS